MDDNEVKLAGYSNVGCDEPTEDHVREVNAHAMPFIKMLASQPEQIRRDIPGSVVCSMAINSGDPMHFLLGLVSACYTSTVQWSNDELHQLPETN